MTTYEIRLVPSTPAFQQRVSLEGAFYSLRIRWNHRAQGWFLDLLDGSGDVVVIGGVRLVIDTPLLRRYGGTPGLPPGQFLLRSGAAPPVDPGYDDLGVNARLFYLDAADVADARAE